MRIPRTNRRRFLKNATHAAVGMAIGTTVAPSRTRAAPTARSRKFVIGLMGAGERGAWFITDGLVKRPDVEVAYVCDVDENRMNKVARTVEERRGTKPKVVKDFRRMLDDKDVHAVFNTTPDHWHALGTISACQAGKDVYVEKPASHNIWEGGKMVEAARKYDRIVQLGSQTRSAPYARAAVEYLRSGKLGDIHLVRVLNMKTRPTIGKKPDGPVPPGVDYDAWLGPAPLRPFNPNHFHYKWHWFWDYSGGDIINDGVHQIDVARWLIGKDYPKAVSATGGILSFDDDQETPDTQVVTWDYDDMTLVFELTLWTPYMKKTDFGFRNTDALPDWRFNATKVEVYGTKGIMFMGRQGNGWQVFDADHKEIASGPGRRPYEVHVDNFFECVESRARPNADIEEGHRSTILCQTGNISYRLGGRKLKFDGKTETFVNDAEANRLAKRVGRERWIVPEQV